MIKGNYTHKGTSVVCIIPKKNANFGDNVKELIKFAA